MFKQRFATMMHVFASINFNDTLGKIKHIKNENKKKRSKRDRKLPNFANNFPPDGAEQQYNSIEHETSDIFRTRKNQNDLPAMVRINDIPTAKYSPKMQLKHSSIT